MAVKIGSARIDEHGAAHGGAAGDQTGREVSTQDWYLHSKGWRVLRAIDSAVAEKIAKAMQAACDNSKIGYDQYQRDTLYKQVASAGYDPAKATTACETDCSALVRVCVAYALGKAVDNFRTTDECAILLKTGAFVEMTDSKYTTGSAYLKRGDILCTKTQGHTVVVLSDGSKAEVAAPAADGGAPKVTITGSTVNLRDMPGTEYGKVVAQVHKGDKLKHIGMECCGWYAVQYDRGYAWVSGKYAEVC